MTYSHFFEFVLQFGYSQNQGSFSFMVLSYFSKSSRIFSAMCLWFKANSHTHCYETRKIRYLSWNPINPNSILHSKWWNLWKWIILNLELILHSLKIFVCIGRMRYGSVVMWLVMPLGYWIKNNNTTIWLNILPFVCALDILFNARCVIIAP